MPPSIFDGRALTEVHEHFDLENNKTGYTVIHHEPLWNDADRERALALYVYERSMCPCGCGLPIEESHDPKRGFVIEEATCYARRAIDKIERQEAEKAEKRKLPDGWADGKVWFVDSTYLPETNGGKRG